MTQVLGSEDLVARLHVEVMQSHKIPSRLDLADDVCWIVAGTMSLSGTYQSRRELSEAYLAPLLESFPQGLRRTIDRPVISQGRHAIIVGRIMGLSKHGKPCNIQCVWVYTIDHGQVTRVVEYPDTAAFETTVHNRRLTMTVIPNHETPPSPPTTEYLEAMVNRRSPDAVHRLPGVSPISGSWWGHAGFQSFAERCFEVIDFRTLNIVRDEWIVKRPDLVAFLAHGEGVKSVDGTSYENTYIHLIHNRDGKVVDSTEWCDSLLIETALFRKRLE